jgi:hypothetical protein
MDSQPKSQHSKGWLSLQGYHARLVRFTFLVAPSMAKVVNSSGRNHTVIKNKKRAVKGSDLNNFWGKLLIILFNNFFKLFCICFI